MEFSVKVSILSLKRDLSDEKEHLKYMVFWTALIFIWRDYLSFEISPSFLSRQNYLTNWQHWTINLLVYNRNQQLQVCYDHMYALCFFFTSTFQFQWHFPKISWKWWDHVMLLITCNEVVTCRIKFFHSILMNWPSWNSCSLYFIQYDHKFQGQKAKIFETCACIISPQWGGIHFRFANDSWIQRSTGYVSSEINIFCVSKVI